MCRIIAERQRQQQEHLSQAADLQQRQMEADQKEHLRQAADLQQWQKEY